MTHVMLDLETFGTKPGCVIRSVGAVVFGLDGSVGDRFYANIDRQSAVAAGLTIDPRTERWWSEQAVDAQAALEVNPQPLYDVIYGFNAWWHSVGGTQVWAQGATFDPPLYEAAATAVGLTAPWQFWNVRDTRTVYEICNFDPRDVPRTRVHHNALDDTLHQVALVAAALRRRRPASGEGVFG